jgi:hypothetical protein
MKPRHLHQASPLTPHLGAVLSISSARSVSTVPVFHSKDTYRGMHERTRTLSAIPTSSSSAALSSLTHLPTVTRPPSPQPVVFFPPHNPHANIDGIHPLLPSPYMSNHMTVLMRRTPLKESYDRVMRAKVAASQLSVYRHRPCQAPGSPFTSEPFAYIFFLLVNMY